jgi:hypothetical protein
LQLIPLLPNQVCDGGIAKLWHIDDIVYDIHISVAAPVPSSRISFPQKNPASLPPVHTSTSLLATYSMFITRQNYNCVTYLSCLFPMNISDSLRRHFVLSFPNNVDATEM